MLRGAAKFYYYINAQTRANGRHVLYASFVKLFYAKYDYYFIIC